LKSLKWTNITSFFLIKTNGWKDPLKLLFLCEFKCKKKSTKCLFQSKLIRWFLRVRSGVILVFIFQILIFSFIKAFLRLRL
jgi:hypothetical protein